MARTPKEIAESLYSEFEESSTEFQQELHQYRGQFANQPAAKHYVDAALSVLAAALGSEEEESLAVAGITPEGRENPQQCEIVVLSAGLLFHTAFAISENKAPVVSVIPRNSIKSLTIKAAAPYTQPETPGRFKFTAEYDGGLVLDFPLKGNHPNSASTLGNALSGLRADLENKP
jgi:hypothetical protein